MKRLLIAALFLCFGALPAAAASTWTYDGNYSSPKVKYYADPAGVDTANTCTASTNPCSLQYATQIATATSLVSASMVAVQLNSGTYKCGFGVSGPFSAGGGSTGAGFVGFIGTDQGDSVLNDEGSLASCVNQGSAAIVASNGARIALRRMTITSTDGADLFANSWSVIYIDKNVVFGPACSGQGAGCLTSGQLHSEQFGSIITGYNYTNAAVSFTGSISTVAGGTLTVTGSPSYIGVGMCFQGAGVTAGTCVTANGTGTGGTGTYLVNNSQTVASEAMTGFTQASHWQSVLNGQIINPESGPYTITSTGSPDYTAWAEIGSGSTLYESGGSLAAVFSGTVTGAQCFVHTGGIFEGNPSPPTLPGNSPCIIGNGGIIHPMPHPTIDATNAPTGLGTGGTATIGANGGSASTSGDHSWLIALNTGTAATAASGQVQLDFALTETNIRCVPVLVTGTAGWNGQATLQLSSINSADAVIVWNNNSVNLTANKVYYLEGVCQNDKLSYDTFN